MTNNKRLDFSGDPDHDADPRFKKGIFTIRHRGNCTNFADDSKSRRRIAMKLF